MTGLNFRSGPSNGFVGVDIEDLQWISCLRYNWVMGLSQCPKFDDQGAITPWSTPLMWMEKKLVPCVWSWGNITPNPPTRPWDLVPCNLYIYIFFNDHVTFFNRKVMAFTLTCVWKRKQDTRGLFTLIGRKLAGLNAIAFIL